jgi:hypothetical protein
VTRTYDTREIPASTEQICTDVTCSICGETHGRDTIGPGVNWGTEPYQVETIIVARRVGTENPYQGTLETTEYDVCSSCYQKHILAALEALGAVPTVTKREWG